MDEELVTIKQFDSLTWNLFYCAMNFISLIPNILLLYIIVKNHLYKNNFHYIIVNLTIINMVQIINDCLVFRTDLRPPSTYVNETIIISSMFAFNAAIIASLLLFDIFLISEIYSVTITYFIWFSSIFSEIFIVLSNNVYVYVFQMVFVISGITLCLVILMIKVFQPLRSICPHNYEIRLIIASFVIIINFTTISLQTFTIFSYSFESVTTNTMSLLLHGYGILTFMLMKSYDQDFKHFVAILFNTNRYPADIGIEIIASDQWHYEEDL